MKNVPILLLSLLLLTGSSEMMPAEGNQLADLQKVGPIPAEVTWRGQTYVVSDQLLLPWEIGSHLGQAAFVRGTRSIYEIKGENTGEKLAIQQMGKFYILATLAK